MISKVKSITGTKVWNGPNGDVFYHLMEMENGDKVNIGKKTDNFFKVGDEINYEVVFTDEYGVKKIKEIKEDYKKPGYVQVNPRITAVSMAMSYAKDIVVGGQAELKDIEFVADRIYNRMLKNINILENLTK